MNAPIDNKTFRGPWVLEARCDVTWAGAVHVGSGERLSALSDAPLLRDAEGCFWLPGSSVRGVFRDWCEREAPMLGCSREDFIRLFGPATGEMKKHDRSGRLSVRDALVRIPEDGPKDEVQDHVRIEPRTGAAADKGKFDQEVARPAMTTLVLRYEGDGPEDPEVRLLVAAVEALRQGVLGLGAKTGWGLGCPRKVDVTWNAASRGRPDPLASWLATRLAGQESLAPLDPEPTTGKAQTAVAHDPSAVPWTWLRLDLALQFDGPMLVAGPDRQAERTGDLGRNVRAGYLADPDGRPLLEGSSLRGAMQAHARRIATTLDVPDVANTLFGTIRDDKDGGQRGLLRVWPGVFTGPYVSVTKPQVASEPVREEDRDQKEPATVVLDHVAIDRVTGFAAENRLFSTLALASPRFDTSLVVRWRPGMDDPRSLALLLFTLRDMTDGWLWVGSRTTRGYGHLKQVSIQGGVLSTIRRQEVPQADTKKTPAVLYTRLPDRLIEKGATVADLANLDGIREAMLSWQEGLPTFQAQEANHVG